MNLPHLEVYLVYKKIDKTQKKGNFDNFFSNLDTLDQDLADSILFLESDGAWQYSRFIDANHAVLKAYLPQTAIKGSTDGLALQKGFLTRSHIHGCFPAWERGTVYIKNPFFDEELCG